MATITDRPDISVDIISGVYCIGETSSVIGVIISVWTWMDL